MVSRGIRKGRYPFRRATVSRRSARLFRGTAPSAQGQGMLFTPRTLGNPLSFSERKYFDSQVANRTINAVTTTFTGGMCNPTTLNTCFAPVAGTGINDRIGRSVRVVKFSIRGQITFPVIEDGTNTVALIPIIARVICVVDRQSNGAAMQSQELIGSGTNDPAIDMFQNTAAFGRFTVLKDRRYVLQDPNIGGSNSTYDRNGRTVLFEYTVKFRKGLRVQFNSGVAGSVNDIANNSINVIAVVNNAAAAPVMDYKCRTTYYDS